MASNERLRGSIASAGLRPHELAEAVGVDPKTVERWITQGRRPHRQLRLKAAEHLNVDEVYIWPEVMKDPKVQSASVAELIELHPARAGMPPAVWQQLISSCREALDVLAYSATFLFDGYDLTTVAKKKAAEGVRVRILLGDADSDAVRIRAEEEGTPGGLQGRIQLHHRYLREVEGAPGVEVRSHSTTLYNSLFRFDQDLLVNCHVYGAPAGQSPVLHLRRIAGGRLWDHYMRSFDEVWRLSATEG